MQSSKSVKQAVYAVLNQEIEAGRLTLEQLLRPRFVGHCNDFAMLIQAITSNAHLTSETVRSETVLRYIRQYKATKARTLQNSQNGTNV